MSETERFCFNIDEALTVMAVLEEIVVVLERIEAQVTIGGGSAGELLDDYVVESKIFRRLSKARREMFEALERKLGEDEMIALIEQRVRYFPS